MESKGKLSKIFGCWVNGVKSTDIYGIPVSLNFNGEETFKTFIGGWGTIVLALIICIVTFFQMKTMILKEDNTLITTTLYRDLFETPNTLDAGKYGFFFGLNFESLSGTFDSSVFFDRTYFTTSLKAISGNLSDGYNSIDIPIVEGCDAVIPNALNPESIIRFGTAGFFWPSEREFVLGGSIISEAYSYMQISIDKCTGEAYWQSDAQINAALSDFRVIFGYNEQYFDSSKYDSLISSRIPLDNEFYLINGLNQMVTVGVMINEVETYDNYLNPFELQEAKYASVSKASLRISSSQSRVFQLVFSQDSEYIHTTRKVYTIFDVFGHIGGIMGLLIPTFSVFINLLANKIYVMSLLSNFYQVEKPLNPFKKILPVNVQNVRSKPVMLSASSKIYEESKQNITWTEIDPELPPDDPNLSIDEIIKSRKAYPFSWKTVLALIFWPMKWISDKRDVKKNSKLFKIGKSRISNEMDLRTILEASRTSKILSKLILDEEQRMLIWYHNDMVLRETKDTDRNETLSNKLERIGSILWVKNKSEIGQSMRRDDSVLSKPDSSSSKNITNRLFKQILAGKVSKN